MTVQYSTKQAAKNAAIAALGKDAKEGTDFEVVKTKAAMFYWIDLSEKAIEAAAAENTSTVEEAMKAKAADFGIDEATLKQCLAIADAVGASTKLVQKAPKPKKEKLPGAKLGRRPLLSGIIAEMQATGKPVRLLVNSMTNAYCQPKFDAIYKAAVDGNAEEVAKLRDAQKGTNTYSNMIRAYADLMLGHLNQNKEAA